MHFSFSVLLSAMVMTCADTDIVRRHSRGTEGTSACVFLLSSSSNHITQTQRDLYIALRDLFIRHDRLSLDQVERLKKRVETTSLKLENVRSAQKEGWEDERERLAGLIEKDQATIAAQLSRRIFIRAW